MTDTSKVDLGVAAALVAAATRFHWTWAAADAERFCVDLGWTPVELTTAGMSAATTADVNFPQARFAFFRDKVGLITVNVTDLVDPTTNPAAQQFLDEAFIALHACLEQKLGPPARRIPGAEPSWTWETPLVWVHLAGLARSVKIRLVSPEYQEFSDEAEAAGL